MCKYESTCTRSFLHAYEDPILCTHSDFQKPKKKKKKTSFLHLCCGLERIPHRLGSFQTPFNTIKSLTWYISKHIEIPLENNKIH